VKLLFALATLAGSMGLLVTDWAGQAFPYL
jgi:hypothetical protein